MAELAGEFLTERLNSRQLLALLFICESKRKNTLPSISFGGGARPAAWIEFVERFGARLAKLPESERAYLTGSHLQSAEELDLYNNQLLQGLLDEHRVLLNQLIQELEADSRFS